MGGAADARRIACDARIIPAVLGGTSELLDLGRSRRLFTGGVRRALVLRDRGCAFPGCSIPAAWCQAHHIRPWSAGGRTRVEDRGEGTVSVPADLLAASAVAPATCWRPCRGRLAFCPSRATARSCESAGPS